MHFQMGWVTNADPQISHTYGSNDVKMKTGRPIGTARFEVVYARRKIRRSTATTDDQRQASERGK